MTRGTGPVRRGAGLVRLAICLSLAIVVGVVGWTVLSDPVGREDGARALPGPQSPDGEAGGPAVLAALEDLGPEGGGASASMPSGLERSPTRRRVEAPAPRAPSPTPAPSQSPPVSKVVVLDAYGEPVPGVAIVARHGGAELARTDAAGAFAYIASMGPLEKLQVLDTARVVFASGRRTEVGRSEGVLVAADAVKVAGSVTDGEDRPVERARVSVEIPANWRLAGADIEIVRRGFEAVSSESGRFRLARVPSFAGATLVARKRGYVPVGLGVPVVDRTDLALRLTRTSAAGLLVAGVVLEPDGRPAAGAEVRFHTAADSTGEEGDFRLEVAAAAPEEVAPDDSLVAWIAGRSPALLPAFGRRLLDAGNEPIWVTLVLGDAAETIRGRLVNAASSGRPLDGWEVRLVGGTRVSAGYPPVLAEDLASGGSNVARTDRDGAFELGGLVPERSYRLRAYHRGLMESAESEPVPAGTDGYLFRLPERGVRERVEGVVIARDGTPLEGLSVRLSIVVGDDGRSTHSNQGTITSSDGSFTLTDVPRSEVFVRVTGAGILETRRPIAPVEDAAALVIEVSRIAFLEVEDAGEASEVRILDREGRPMPIRTGETALRPYSGQLEDGRSPRILLGEEAAEALFLRDGAELARVPLALVPGDVARIRL